jgi:hypothetical protein
MANRREIKKEIKQKTNLLIEDAFIESINGGKKEAEKMDKIIDELIDARYEMISKVSTYPKNGSSSEIKKHFSALQSELSNKVEEYDKKIGHVG